MVGSTYTAAVPRLSIQDARTQIRVNVDGEKEGKRN